MTDKIRERLKNQGVEFTRHAAKVHLKRAGVTLSDEWKSDPSKSKVEKNSVIKTVTIPKKLFNQLLEIAHTAWHHMDESEDDGSYDQKRLNKALDKFTDEDAIDIHEKIAELKEQFKS